MFSTLNKTKYGDCVACGSKDTEVVKVKKDTYCTQCHQKNKALEQIEKQKRKNALRLDGSKVRKLGKEMRTEGIVDSVQELIIDLDRIFSRWLRLRDMESDEKITCYICDRRVNWQKAQAMHFISRQHIGVRFLTDNVKSGCVTCNVEKRGNLVEYEKRLEQERPGIVEWLREQSHTVTSPSRDELKQLLCDYQFKLNQIERAKGLKP